MFIASYITPPPPANRIGHSLSVSLLSALLLGSFSGNATALAQRQPDNSLNSREDCVGKYGHMSYYGAAMTMSIPTDATNVLCIHQVANTVNLTIPTAPGVYSYARDNLRMFIPISTQISRVRVNIPGGSQGGVPAPYRELGNDFVHNLTKIGTDNGQTIWRITPNDEVGLKLWNGSSCGPDSIQDMKNPDFAVNSNRHHSGFLDNYVLTVKSGTQGAAYRKALDGCNYHAHIVSEIVLLKPDAINGRVSIPARPLGKIELQSRNYGILAGHIDFDINLPAMSFTFQSRTCRYQGQTEQTVKLHKIGLGHFANGRNEVYGGETTISLRCPRSQNVESYVTFTDINSNNTSDILSLTKTSTAGNVGLRIYVNDDTSPVKFGPVVYNPGTKNTRGQAITKQDYMRKVSDPHDDERTHNLKLVAKYVRTTNDQPIIPGTVRGEMMFTFSYY